MAALSCALRDGCSEGGEAVQDCGPDLKRGDLPVEVTGHDALARELEAAHPLPGSGLPANHERVGLDLASSVIAAPSLPDRPAKASAPAKGLVAHGCSCCLFLPRLSGLAGRDDGCRSARRDGRMAGPGVKRHGSRQLCGERARHGAWCLATGLVLRCPVAGFVSAVDITVGVFTTVVPPAPAVAEPMLTTVVDPDAPPIAPLVASDGQATRLPAGDAGAYPLVSQRFSEPVRVMTAVRDQPIGGRQTAEDHAHPDLGSVRRWCDEDRQHSTRHDAETCSYVRQRRRADADVHDQLLTVTSREVVRLFLEQVRFEFVPVLHRLQGRLAAQG